MRATIYKPETVELQIESATILSSDEALALPDTIRRTGYWWWLRSPGCFEDFAAMVLSDGWVRRGGHFIFHEYGVRPVFVVSNLEDLHLTIGETITIKSKRYVVIDTNKILYNDEPVYYKFNSNNSNDYETSDLKQFVDSWLEDLKCEA